jgi:outer membrane protein
MPIPAHPPTPSRPVWLRRFSGPALAALLSVPVCGASLLTAAPAAAEGTPIKIAVIDVRRAIAETEAGLRVQAQLKRIFDTRQGELETKNRQLQTDKEALEKEAQSGKTPKEALQKKYERLLQADAELQRLQVDSQREMARKEQELTTPILSGILEAVKRIAAQEGFEMVLEKSAVPYFRGDLELTDRAIQMFNGLTPAPKGSGPVGGPPVPKSATPPATPAKTAPKK